MPNNRKMSLEETALEAINKHWREKGIPPTYQYIVDHSDIGTKSYVGVILKRLEDQGKIKIVKSKAVPTWVEQRVTS